MAWETELGGQRGEDKGNNHRDSLRPSPRPPYLQQPGLESVVQQDVKAQNFKAGTVECVVGEAGVVVMLDDGLGRHDCLDNDILHISPYLLHVVAVALHVRVEGGELPGREPQAMRHDSPCLVI